MYYLNGTTERFYSQLECPRTTLFVRRQNLYNYVCIIYYYRFY